jgi:hypothetical protein
MAKRTTIKATPKIAQDPYLPALGKIWPTILLAYDNFKELKPIIVYQIRQKKVLAYPAQAYINDLTERTREEARRIYAEAAAAGKFMVFVYDTRKRVFRSYVFSVEAPEGSRSEGAV